MEGKVIIFGVGMRMQELKARGALDKIEIIAYCDNNKNIIGNKIEGIDIISPDRLDDYKYDFILISTEQYFSQIERQLIEIYKVDKSKIRHFELSRDKYLGEISYWKAIYNVSGKQFYNEHYKKYMLEIAQECDDLFWKDKVVVDFGCGPAGSLTWTKTPAVKIGVDVLAEKYLEEFGKEIVKHDMIYVTSSEDIIPIPSEYADYLITINSLDHVYNLDMVVKELLRILKTNGVLLASFNINEDETECEPQTLTETKLEEVLLKYFDIQNYSLVYTGKKNKNGEKEATLFVKGVKKSLEVNI